MRVYLLIIGLLCVGGISAAQDRTGATSQRAGVGRLPHIEVDVGKRQVRVDCEALHCEAPLEFFCVTAGGNEHESVIRTRAKPSDIHTGLLMLGLKPGEPLRFSQAAKKWFAPHGPPLNISVEYDKDGKHYAMPAYKLMRNVKTKQPMPSTTWIFAGSRVMPDGQYAADVTSYVVSIVNFDLTLIDVPQLVSSANETLEWEANLDLLPPLGSPMTMIIEPVDKDAAAPTSSPAATQPLGASGGSASSALTDVHIDQQKVDALRARWDRDVKPHAQALREAAQAQYEVISALRREQQRLIDEADRIQRQVDELEREYQQMTTPRPDDSPSR